MSLATATVQGKKHSATITVSSANPFDLTFVAKLTYRRIKVSATFAHNLTGPIGVTGCREVTLHNHSLDNVELTAEDFAEARTILTYMWAVVKSAAFAAQRANLLTKAAEFALDGETNKADRCVDAAARLA